MMDSTPKRSFFEVWSIPLAIVVAGLFIAGAVYMKGPTGGSATAPNQFDVKNTKTTMKPVSAEDHLLGNPDADLIIVVYSDTECPYCKVFHNTMRQIMAEYGKNGRVAWVYRLLPLEQLHQRAPKETEAALCVSELGGKAKFWDYLDSIFETTGSNDSLDTAQLPLLASKLGIDTKAFNSCLSSGKYTATVKAMVQEGMQAGAQGTPYSVIVTKKGETFPIEGAFPYANLKPIIDSLLKSK